MRSVTAPPSKQQAEARPAIRRPARGAARRGVLNSAPVQVGIYLVVVALILKAAYSGAQSMGYNWQWYNVPKYLGQFTDDGFQAGELLQGLGMTILLSVLSFVLAVIIGMGLALLRLSSLVIGRPAAVVIVELVRNLPLLVQVYMFYFVLGPIFGWDRFTAAVMVLSVFHGVLVSEIVRGGIASVPAGQWEGAQSIGMSRLQQYRYIILPQALRIMLPPLTGEVISLIKSSAIVSVIGVAELTTVGRNVVSDTYMSFEIWFTVAAMYLVLTVALSFAVGGLERRLKRDG